MLVGAIVTVLLMAAGYSEENHAVVDLMINQPIYVLVLLAIIWAPLAEELTFRLPLKYSPFRFGFGLAFIVVLVINLLAIIWPPVTDLIPWLYPDSRIVDLLIGVGIIAVIGCTVGWILKKKTSMNAFNDFYSNKFIWLFYGSALIFGVLHLANYARLDQIWYLTPLLIFPQVMLGLVLGYVRMRYGLGWAMLNHLIHNALLVIPAVLFSMLSADLVKSLEYGETVDLGNIAGHDLAILSLIGWGAMVSGIIVLILLINLIWEASREARKIKS